MSTDAGAQLEKEYREGSRKGGTVSLRSFDEGIALTLEPEEDDGNYYLNIAGVDHPPGLPGVPLTFTFPDDIFEKYEIPVVLIRRDDVYPAMQRWHPGAEQYRAPAKQSLPVVVQVAGVNQTGPDRLETLTQAQPFDIMYTLSIIARNRGSTQHNKANAILDYVLRRYPPYGKIYVKDSIDNQRTYEAFMEGVGMLDSTPEIGSRSIGFAVTVRVEAEFDLVDPGIYPTVTRRIYNWSKIRIGGR